ncbi:hypothetical protein JSY14_03020 [Brachybacterium sp. EF45031]|uniref:DUF6541 family protein n=1 Tax=Brachybacterium sillae TaxID=2810536 RepID=UPI00217F0AF8|nr:DUF6541 family protein [Brachybacterium sillae]MCS6711037.1 hypothetical protein [Brachybacterium sillae]
MSGLLQFSLAAIAVLLVGHLPGWLTVRTLGGSRRLAVALAPALSLAIAGLGAIGAELLQVRWSWIAFSASTVVTLVLAVGLRSLGLALPNVALGPVSAERDAPAQRWIWAGAIIGGLAVALLPIAQAAGRPDAILERYDTLFHLTALAHIRSTGNGSSLTLNSIASTSGVPRSYPAAFHDLVAIIPSIEIPILLNASVVVLSTVPWLVGIALLSRAVFPRVPWAPPAAATVAAVIPACPLNLWVHLSPIPNLVGFAALPGALAAVTALWSALTQSATPVSDSALQRGVRARDRVSTSATGRDPAARQTGARNVLAAVLLVLFAGIGLTLAQPNVAVTALMLLAVLTAVTGAPLWREHPALAVLPILAILPVLTLMYTPAGSRITGFTGGLRVSLTTALMEIGLGLLTVWPMALGTAIALLWWPGLVVALRERTLRWVGVAWILIAVLYLDAAVDSPANLSILYFRGQDRLAIPLAMLSCLLTVPGARAWGCRLERTRQAPHRLRTRSAAAIAAIAVVLVLTSIPARAENAAKNFDPEYPGRGRFLQADERAAFAQAAPELRNGGAILASPYSGAAHMFALHGLHAYVPVAGTALTEADLQVIRAVPIAGRSPQKCQLLEQQGIGYVYVERTLYQYDNTFTPISQGGDDLGEVVFTTDHSRLIRVDCAGAREL